MAFSINSAVIARLAAGMYGMQLGFFTMTEAINAANALAIQDSPGSDGMNRLMNVLYQRDFANQTTTAVATNLVANLGITGALATSSITLVKDALDAAAPADRGAVIVTIVNKLAAATADATYGAAARAFNAQVDASVAYANSGAGADVTISSLVPIFSLTPMTAAGVDVMRLTGNQDVHINFTNPANQITGLDLNGDGQIKADGVENRITGRAANFEIVDAYPRNPLNHTDTANNFLGDIEFHGEGFNGDGVHTNGNIVLGGLGVDRIFAGVGNDFLAGGGVAQDVAGFDELRGGRNADFFFAEFDPVDRTDGKQLYVDGGTTADDTAAGVQSPQDADWLLLEATDDDEPVFVRLEEDNGIVTNNDNDVSTRSGKSMDIDDVENFDASGNLYGFLDGVNVKIGARAVDSRDTSVASTGSNYGYGSSAQLHVSGSEVRNIIIGGYDNDLIEGNDGNDLLMGGNINFLRNPNLAGIWNNGQDELIGGAGDDDIVFETDGGIYEGGIDQNQSNTDGGNDTLWLTKDAFGKKVAADVTSDSTVRIDLLVGKEGGLDNAAGYGGADRAARTGNYTADQTLYKSGFARAQVQDFESVIATGLGNVDYLAAGTNNPELVFANQQNHFAFMGNLDLRGTNGDNTLYAVGGADVLEGRRGNDSLSGGDGNDDFYFNLAGEDFSGGDGVDVIHRQTDVNNDNIWDTNADGDNLFERDFNIGGSSTFGASKLTVDLGTTNLASADVAMTSFTIKIGGVTFAGPGITALSAANSAAEVAALVHTSYNAQDARVSVVAVGNTIIVTDAPTATQAGRDISDTVAEGYAVGGVVSNGAFSALATFAAAGTSTTKDRLIYKAYEDRLDNEGVNDDSSLGSIISLGEDNYAEDLVINFADEDGDGKATTRIAEDQAYTLTFNNLTTQDRVTITVNGVKYSLQVGVDLDGNIVAAEDGVFDSQANIQAAFLDRLSDFINSFMDDDTSAGAVNSASNGFDTLTLTQRAYNGEETVFMVAPTVTLTNQSGGEPAEVEVSNVSQHEVELLDFDGRNGELNATNVLFIGEVGVNSSRATLETATNAGGKTITGKEAIVIDVGPNNLQDVVFGTTTAVPNNTASNSPLSNVQNGFAVHGDDFLLGGAGIDTINAGTGDDRVEGSIGGATAATGDALDGGKNFYAVQVLGEPQARVYILNKWEAANPTTSLPGLTISTIQLINQTESGTFTESGEFDDTLQFSQKLFTAGTTQFTVIPDDFVVVGGVVQTRNDGAGRVSVDVDGNGTADNWTRFTNFENIRTVSGTSNAVAGDGQGNDTLDVTKLSSVIDGAGGVSYNLTGDGDAGEVRYSANAIITASVAPNVAGAASEDRPTAADYETLVIKVDGVENVLTSTGHDLLRIDETEAAKNNLFSAGLGVDKIVYEDDYGGASGAGQPTMTIRVNSGTDTDTVTMKGGRVGTLNTPSGGAVDTLIGVEYLQIAGEAATSLREDDTIDISSIATGAVVDYTNGEIRIPATAAVGVGVQLVIENIVQMERVIADGNDWVIVADADVMNNNTRSDENNATPAQNILFMTYRDFDDLNTAATTRKSFAAQVLAGQIQQVINQGQFSFSLSEVGTDADIDRVDYHNELGRIVVPVGQGTATTPQYVVVDGDTDGSFSDAESRVDALKSVEEIVAAAGQSIMDYTAVGAARQITFKYVAPSPNPAENQVIEQAVRIADGSGNTLVGLNAFIERYVYNKTTAPVADATWNRIEGSDAAEVVIYEGSEDLVNQSGLDHRFTIDTLTLRGGNNEVRYSPLETSITAVITVTEENAATTTVSEGLISAVVTFQDGLGVNAPSATFLGGMHTITSHTSDNSTAAGNLKLEGSQDAEDVVEFAGLGQKTFILGTSPGVVNVNIGTSVSMVLTGFEFVQDAASNDIYDFASLISTTGLTLLDNAAGDHDVIRVGNDAAAAPFNGGIAGNTTISLDALNTFFTFDFDVLDISPVNLATLTTVNGVVAGLDDELVIGGLGTVATTAVNDFEAVVVSNATIAAHGATFVLNTSANSLVIGTGAGTKTLQFNGNMNNLSFGGTMLGATGVPRATTAVTVTVTGPDAVTIIGSVGADSLTGGNGNDTLRGGSGNDTLNGSFVAAQGARLTQTISGVGTTGGTEGGAGQVFNMGATNTNLFADATPEVADPLDYADNADADQIGATWAAVPLATWIAGLTASGLTAAEAGALTGVTYDAITNELVATFSTGAAGSTITAADLLGASLLGAVGNAVLNATEAATGFVAQVNSADTFVFEATAALNGADTINNFDGSDTLNFQAYFAGTYGGSFGSFIAPTAFAFSGNTHAHLFNKATLSADDFGGPGEMTIANGAKMIFTVSADADGAADATNNSTNVYMVQDTNAGAGITYTVTLVGTLFNLTDALVPPISG